MNIIESVFETAEKFTTNPTLVKINYEKLNNTAKLLKTQIPLVFPKDQESNQYKTCLLELIGNSINYCYWYGKYNIRPLNSSSSKMFKLVKLCFEHYSENSSFFKILLNELINLLSLERFPLLEERIKHLNELKENGCNFVNLVMESDKNDIEPLLDVMLQLFPGYASDIFLKRACLFFIQLNRNLGWFEKSMYKIPVPADYQVPKMLNHYGILKYSKKVKEKINSNCLVPKNSILECEIRASTIIACRQLSIETGWSIPNIDGWFWLQRDDIDVPFHLTITTDY